MVSQSISALFNVEAGDSVVDQRDVDPAVSEAAYPQILPGYVFNKALLKKLLLFMTRSTARNNLLLTGDTGAGKSSVVEQIAARLCIPVFSIACSGKMRLAHFVGSFGLLGGNTVWKDGPLLLAMRHNAIFLADEITRLDHNEQMALAKVLDAGVITVPETGEVVRAGPGFRFVATGNSVGHGDSSGAYNGEKVASAAFLNRFQKLLVDYLPESDEIALLRGIAPELGEQLIERMVKFANHARAAFVSRGGDLRTAVSTRDLVVWSRETVRYTAFGISGAPVNEALDDTILNGATPDDAKVLRELWDQWVQ